MQRSWQFKNKSCSLNTIDWTKDAYDSQAPCLGPSQPWGNATASDRACAPLKPISSTYQAKLDICPHNCSQHSVMPVTRWYLAAHPHLQLNPLCQSIPCLMQAGWISDAGWGKVGSAVISSTGLSAPSIPWLMQARIWGFDPMDCPNHSKLSVRKWSWWHHFNQSLCTNQFPVPSQCRPGHEVRLLFPPTVLNIEC